MKLFHSFRGESTKDKTPLSLLPERDRNTFIRMEADVKIQLKQLKKRKNNNQMESYADVISRLIQKYKGDLSEDFEKFK